MGSLGAISTACATPGWANCLPARTCRARSFSAARFARLFCLMRWRNVAIANSTLLYGFLLLPVSIGPARPLNVTRNVTREHHAAQLLSCGRLCSICPITASPLSRLQVILYQRQNLDTRASQREIRSRKWSTLRDACSADARAGTPFMEEIGLNRVSIEGCFSRNVSVTQNGYPRKEGKGKRAGTGTQKRGSIIYGDNYVRGPRSASVL